MLENLDIWKLLAGLGIFIFGMFTLEEAIRKLSGSAFKRLIHRFTTGRLRSVFSGALVTAVLQSSSAVSLMVLAFVGAGVMTMENAIGVILGANLGTTVTGWIVATVGFKINIENLALPLIALGGLGTIFLGKSDRFSNISKLLVGFGFLFMGLDYMKVSVEGLTAGFDIQQLAEYGLLVFLLAGIVLTALMQSSSATIAIILTALNAGIIDFRMAAAMVIGTNIGTTVTIIIGAIGGQQVKKRVALSHLIFNFTTGIIALLALPLFSYLILDVMNYAGNNVSGIALFHTMFNVLGILVFLPFIGLLARLLVKAFPDRKPDLTAFIDQVNPEVGEAAIAATRKEILHFTEQVLRYNMHLLQIDPKLVILPHNHTAGANHSPATSYESLNMLQGEIFTYAAHIQAHEINEEDANQLQQYLHAARTALHAAKTLNDVRGEIESFESSDNSFLSEQYARFRKRMTETYLQLAAHLYPDDGAHPAEALSEIEARITREDKVFIKETTEAINRFVIRDMEVSSSLVVNRAFVLSGRELAQALQELEA